MIGMLEEQVVGEPRRLSSQPLGSLFPKLVVRKDETTIADFTSTILYRFLRAKGWTHPGKYTTSE